MTVEIGVVFGLAAMAYLIWNVITFLDVKDEKQEWLRFLLVFYFSFTILMIPEYIFLQAPGEGVFERFFTMGLWFLRVIVSLEAIIIVKQIFEWVIEQARGWFK